MKTEKEIVELHQKIMAHMSAFPMIDARYEHLRGWARALRWILDREEAPFELIKELEKKAALIGEKMQ